IRFEVPPVLRLDQPGNPVPVFLRDPLYPHVTWQVLKVHVVVRRKQFPTRHVLLRSLSARSLLLCAYNRGPHLQLDPKGKRCRAEGLCLLQQSGRLAADTPYTGYSDSLPTRTGAASDTLMTSQLNNRRSALWKASRLAGSDFPGSPDITRPITAMLRGDTSNG